MRAFLIVDAVIVLLPIAVLVIWAFAYTWTYPDLLPSEWSLRGFETALSMNRDLPQIVVSSIALSFVVAMLAVVLSLLVARALALHDFKGKRIIDFASLLPLMVSATAFGMGTHVFMLQQGWANTYFGVILVHMLLVVPYTIKTLVEPMKIMGRTYSDQARNLGASTLQAFFHVELAPLLPTIVASMGLAFIVSFGQYFLTLIIGGGKVVTLAIIMVPWVASADRTLAATYALIYLVATLLALVVFDLIGRVLSRGRTHHLA